jgi:hypothetical protein
MYLHSFKLSNVKVVYIVRLFAGVSITLPHFTEKLGGGTARLPEAQAKSHYPSWAAREGAKSRTMYTTRKKCKAAQQGFDSMAGVATIKAMAAFGK